MNNKGFLILEIVLAIFLFSIAILLIFSGVNFSQNNISKTNAKVKSIFVADSGVEFLKSLRNDDFSNLVNGSYWVKEVDGEWILSEEESTLNGSYELKINISGDDSKKQIVSNGNYLNENFILNSYFLNYEDSDFFSSIWNFNEGSGKTTYDNNGAEAKVVKSSWGDGYLNFDGKKSYVSILDYLNEIYDSQEITIESWIYQEYQNKEKIIIAKKANNKNNGAWEFGTMGKNNNYLFFQFLGKNGLLFESEKSVSYNEWHHVAVTFGKEKGEFYLDGNKIGSFSYLDKILKSKRPLQIGRADKNSYYFKGIIDEISFYDKSLSEKEIFKIYQNK